MRSMLMTATNILTIQMMLVVVEMADDRGEKIKYAGDDDDNMENGDDDDGDRDGDGDDDNRMTMMIDMMIG